jgi:hypothetical protein
MNQRKQGGTTYPITLFMADADDHITGLTGLTPTVTLSKNGAAFGAALGAVAEISNGWYTLAGNATDRDTLGELLVHATAANADPFDGRYEIIAIDPFAATLETILTDTNELQTDWHDAGRLDAIVDAINAKTTNLPAAPADDTSIDTQLGTIAAYLDTEIAAILADTNELQTDWADGGRLDLLLDGASAPTVAQIRAEMDTNSTKLADLTTNLSHLHTDVADVHTDVDHIHTDIGNLTTPPTAAANAAALLDYANGIETDLTPRQAWRLSASAAAGVLSGAATNTVAIRSARANHKTRITATVDADGNRTAVTTDVS